VAKLFPRIEVGQTTDREWSARELVRGPAGGQPDDQGDAAFPEKRCLSPE
jgi:hypothetical protein